MALHFWLSLGRATDIKYLLSTYREGLRETELNEDNVEAVIDGFFYEMEYSYWFLYGLRNLNPELSEYEKPLYFIDRFIGNIFWWQSFGIGGRPTVRSVLDKLNVTEKVTAFKELNQTSFQKIDGLGREVAESFTWKGVNATRLDNTVNMVEELESILGQWIDKYSAGYEINSSTDVVGQFQNVTIHEGDITVRNNATFLIENCQFNLTGKLIIRDRAEVIIRNATFISNWNSSEEIEKIGAHPWRTRHVIVEKQAKLTVLNGELIFSASLYPWHGEYHSLILYDQATVNVTESKVTYVNGDGDYIYAYNDSRLWIKDVTISTFKPENPTYQPPTYPKSGLVASGRSEVNVKNSTVDEVYVEGNCTVNISNSNVEHFETFNDSSGVNIIGSTISRLEISDPNSNVWIIDTTVKELTARYSKVWLHNSSVKEIHIYKAKVWVVWDLPLFGQVAVPHAWAPYVFPVIALVITSIVIVAFFFLIRRKRGVKSKPELNASEASRPPSPN